MPELVGSSGIGSTLQFGVPGLVLLVTSVAGSSSVVSTTQFGTGALTSISPLTGGGGVGSSIALGSGWLSHMLAGAAGPPPAAELGTGQLAHVLSGNGLGATSQTGVGQLTLELSGSQGIAGLTELGQGVLVLSLAGDEGVPPPLESDRIPSGLLIFALATSDGIDSGLVFGSGSVDLALVGTSGLSVSNQFGVGSLAHGITSSAGIPSGLVFGDGALSGSLYSSQGIPASEAFGAGGVLTLQVRGYNSVVGDASFGHGNLQVGITGVSGLAEVTGFSSGKVTHQLRGTAGLVEVVQFGSGKLHHQLTAQGGIQSANQFGAGTVEALFKIGFAGSTDWQIMDWLVKINSEGVGFAGGSGFTINGIAVPASQQVAQRAARYRDHVSHLTQQLLNYFDQEDRRIRTVQHTIDHQLLNVAAASIEKMAYETGRHIKMARPEAVPLNLDSRGVYYQLYLPAEVSSFQRIEANKNSVWVDVQSYRDDLPIPSAVKVSTKRQPIRFAEQDALLAVLTNGDVSWSQPQDLVLPGRIHFMIQGEADDLDVEISVVGEEYPTAVWAGDRGLTSEFLQIVDTGYEQTKKAYSRLVSITANNLPDGITIKVLQTDMFLPHRWDAMRTYTSPEYRGIEFERYWCIEKNQLKEVYYTGRFSGYRTIQSYYAPDYLSIAIEPNTCGIFATNGTELLYLDRREPRPEKLDRTALTKAPLWSLRAERDEWAEAQVVKLTPLRTSLSDLTQRYRYLVEKPTGELFSLLPDGSLASYTTTAGFRHGSPAEISVPVMDFGTWTFSLECWGMSGRTVDTAIYNNLQPAPMFRTDLNRQLPQIKGMHFDHFQQLWLWTGDHLVPVDVEYDSYIFDEDNRILYFTDNYLEVRLI